jgi:hypothetical protein
MARSVLIRVKGAVKLLSGATAAVASGVALVAPHAFEAVTRVKVPHSAHHAIQHALKECVEFAGDGWHELREAKSKHGG